MDLNSSDDEEDLPQPPPVPPPPPPTAPVNDEAAQDAQQRLFGIIASSAEEIKVRLCGLPLKGKKKGVPVCLIGYSLVPGEDLH